MTPDEFTNREFFLDVGDGHKLYIQDWGNPKAKSPIIFLHGGPGDGTQDGLKISFDPEEQRAIFFDQRGAGQSTPKGSRETTPKLVSDIEKIRKRLNLSKIILAGGSWGSTLALCYAIKYPQYVKGMVIGGVWTGTKAESVFLDEGQVHHFFPKFGSNILNRTPVKHRSKPTRYHFKQALQGTAEAQKASAFAYQSLVYGALRLTDYPALNNKNYYENYDPTGFQIAIHYLAAQCFLPDNYIQRNVSKLTMPIWIVQGRYDMICPPITAYQLNKSLANSRLIMTVSGHGSEHENWNLIRTLLLQMARI